MDDIRINKKIIKTSIINLSLLKFNFSFCSKILIKYNKQAELGSSLMNQASLVFLLNSEGDNSDIVNSIHKILDVLKKKDEIDDQSDEESSYIVKNEKNFLSSKISPISKFNEYKSVQKDLLFYNNFRTNNFNKTIKSLIININDFLKTEKKESSNLIEKNISKETIRTENKIQNISHQKKLDKSAIKKDNIKTSNLKENSKSSNYVKEELDQPKIETKTTSTKSITEDVNTSQKIQNFTSELKRINKKIIESQIQKIKVDKIGFDIVNRSTKFNKSIYNKVNKTISSVINSDKRIQFFSKASKDIVLFNKKFKNYSVIKDLQNIISNYKENKDTTIYSKKKRKKNIFDTIYDNKLLQKKISKVNDITNYSKFTKINKSKNISLHKTNIENITRSQKEISNQDSKKVFKINKVKETFSKKDIIKSFNFLNELYDKYIITSRNNRKILHEDSFLSYDNSYFSDVYNRFFKNIKNKNITKNYDTATLQYTKSISTTNKNKLFENIKDVNKINFIEQTDLKKTNLNFHNLIHHKKIIKENKQIKDLNTESVSNIKEQNYLRNIVHKNELNIKKLIEECVTEKIMKTQETISKHTTTHYNERVLKMLETNERKFNSTERTISKSEIQEMIDNSIPSINIRHIAELVSERLERMSNVNNYKSTF